MKRLTILFLVIFLSLNTIGQNKSKIVLKEIKKISVFDQKLSKGFDDKYLSSETTYNENGEILEEKKISGNGEIKSWEKYNYDKEGNCIEEVFLDDKGKVDKRNVIIFENGLKTIKEYYNSDGKLVRIRTYEYEYR